MKVAIITAVWQRPEIFELYAQGVKNLAPKHELKTFIVGSEGKKSRELATKHGFSYTEFSNKDLSKKHNAACMAARLWRPDYCLFLGSDDILSPECYSLLEEEMAKGTDFIGFKDFYFYDASTGKASYWGGYQDNRKGHTVGAGRVISKRLMDKWRWQPFESRHARVLDDSMQQKISKMPHSSKVISLKESGVCALDIKSSVNMTPFELWPNTSYISTEVIARQFPYVMKIKQDPSEDMRNKISPFSFVHPSAIMGKGNVVMEGAIIREGAIIGDNNYFGPYCVIGEVPEKHGYFKTYGKVIIGSNNRFEKQVTIDSGTNESEPTRIGDNNILLKNAHVGHNAVLKNGVILSCNVCIGGTTVIGDKCNFGLGAVAHQRLTIPEGVMVGMNSTVTKQSKLKPGFKYAGSPVKELGQNIR